MLFLSDFVRFFLCLFLRGYFSGVDDGLAFCKNGDLMRKLRRQRYQQQ